MTRYSIVTQKKNSTLMIFTEQVSYTDKFITYHVGKLKRNFGTGILVEYMIEKMVETHLVVKIYNCHTLGFEGEANFYHVSVVSGR